MLRSLCVVLSVACLLAGTAGCNDDKLLSRRTIAQLYCRENRRDCAEFITHPAQTSGSRPTPTTPSSVEPIDPQEDRSFISQRRFFTGVAIITQHDPNDWTGEQFRANSQEVSLTTAESDGTVTTEMKRMTLATFSALRAFDTLLELYARARHTVCTDGQGRRYWFTELPTQRDVANGIICRLPNDPTPLRYSVSLLHFPSDSSVDSVAEWQRQDAQFQNSVGYPVDCGAVGNTSPPDPATCRNQCGR